MSTNKMSDQPADARSSQPRGRTGLAKVRRRANIPAFLATGGILGLIAGVLYSHTTGNGAYSDTTGTAYVAIIFAAVGVLIAALVIIALDKRADR